MPDSASKAEQLAAIECTREAAEVRGTFRILVLSFGAFRPLVLSFGTTTHIRRFLFQWSLLLLLKTFLQLAFFQDVLLHPLEAVFLQLGLSMISGH